MPYNPPNFDLQEALGTGLEQFSAYLRWAAIITLFGGLVYTIWEYNTKGWQAALPVARSTIIAVACLGFSLPVMNRIIMFFFGQDAGFL